MTFPADDNGDRDEAMPSPQEGTPAEQEASQQETAARAAMEELLRIDHQLPFGPRFFLVQLAAFVRDRCPETSERLPHVDLWVQGGPIAVCHIVAVAPRWVAVAALADHEHGEMRTEILVYESISRVTISGADLDSRAIGFDRSRRPAFVEDSGLSPEEALAAARYGASGADT